MVALLIFCSATFSALGIWQIQRLHWKRALIARVDARIHAPPQPPPQPSQWPQITKRRDDYEYRRIELKGHYLRDRNILTQAVTDLGAGHWVLTPLRTHASGIVLINRGFVPAGAHAAAAPAGEVTVRGLLRISEPGGGFLRDNRPAENRWYSRDVAAIAQALQLHDVAPYFIDAESTGNVTGWPRAGMTVVRFRNQHRQYALTWFALAAMSLWGLRRVLSEARGLRHHAHDGQI